MDSSGFRSFLGLVKFSFGSERLRTVFSSQDSTNVESAFLRMARELKNGYEGESHLQAIDDGRVLLESRKVGKWGCCT